MLYALLGAVAIGLVLGLLGSGGSILTVPVLVYLAGEPDKVAIAESLAIVGAIAAAGALPYARQKLVDWHSVVYFGLPGMGGTYAGAALSRHVPGAVQLALFAVVMLLAAGLMMRGARGEEADSHARQALWKIATEGFFVGMLTGLVGVGGGFLIVPALVLLGGLSMRKAVGTSLLIIAAKSATGFGKYLDVLTGTGQHVDWALIGLFTAIGIAGSFAGNALSRRVPQARLRQGFAVFLLLMGSFILIKETPRALHPAPAAPQTATARPATLTTTRPLHLSPEETRAFLDQHPEAVVLDVRTAAEFAQGHLKDARLFDLYAADFAARVAALDPAPPYVVYCRSGNRSRQAGALMAERGLRVYDAGAFSALVAAGVPASR